MRHTLSALLAVLAALAVPATAAAQPAPDIIEFSLPSTLQPGQDGILTVRATNRGQPATNGSISLSFPDQEAVVVIDASPVRTAGASPEVYRPGQMIANQQKQSVPAVYPLAELYVDETWPTGVQKFLTVRVTAPTTMTVLRVQARVTMRADTVFFNFPQTGPADQQGFPVLVQSIAVAFPVPATPVPTSTPTPVPTVSPAPTPAPTTVLAAPIAPPLIATSVPQPTAPPTSPPTPSTPPTPLAPTPQVVDSTPSAMLMLLGILAIAGLVAALAIVLTRRPRSATSTVAAIPMYQPGSTGSAPVPVGYQIVGPPKYGGMAVVYKAVQLALNRDVALKVLSPSLGADPSFIARFHAEARHTASLDHPNIVPIYDLGEAGGSVFIAMRWINGLSLQELLAREQRLPLPRTILIATQVADALDYAHGRGIIHRDVKPANIMIEPGDRATLTDFGIARVVGSSQLTRTGSIVGTPDYLSPEQARGAEVDAQTDLYALAVVTFEMLAGRPPFQSDNPLSVVHAQIATPPPAVTVFNPSVPPEVAVVLQRAMAKAPGDRFASCGDFVEAVRQAAAAVV